MLRGLVAVLAVAIGPMAAAYCLLPLVILAFGHNVYDIDDRLLGLYLIWSAVFVPHVWSYGRGHGRMPAAMTWALGQWTIVGVVVGLATRSKGRARLAAYAIVAALVVAGITHVVLRMLGYHVALEGI